MLRTRVIITFLLFVSGGLAADPPLSVQLLDGKSLSGELVSINDREIKLKVEGKEIIRPLESVLQIDFQAMPTGAPPKDTFVAVGLTDGSALRCSKFAIKGKDATLTLAAGPSLTVPISALTYFLNEANDPALAKQFREYVARSKQQHTDYLMVKQKGSNTLNGLDGTVGDGDAMGENVEFTRQGQKRSISLAKTQGLIFYREADAKMAPAICKLLDTARNEIQVGTVAKTDKGLTVTTPAGAKIEYPRALIARLDYSKGKLTFLSDIDPVEVVETCTEGPDSVQHYHRDKNLDNGPIRIGPTPYPKGLAMHAHSEIEYDLKGEYREFKAVIGVEDGIGGGEGPTLVKILGDGKELYSRKHAKGERFDPPAAPVKPVGVGTKKPEQLWALPVKLSVVNVQKLRIIVASGDMLDLSKHATLAEAQVSK
jgi:hypothetical protein